MNGRPLTSAGLSSISSIARFNLALDSNICYFFWDLSKIVKSSLSCRHPVRIGFYSLNMLFLCLDTPRLKMVGDNSMSVWVLWALVVV